MKQGWAPDAFEYVIFPLHFLKDVHKKKEYGVTLRKILIYGTMNYFMNKEYDTNHIMKQVIYLYFQQGLSLNLSNEIENAIEKEKLYFNPEKRGGFNGTEFVPDEYSIETLQEWLKNNPSLMKEAVFAVKMNAAKDHFTNFDLQSMFEKWKQITTEISDFEKEFGKDVKTSVRVEIVRDFLKYPDPITFSAYCALRSIQGRNQYMRTAKQTILMRMAGAKSKEVFATCTPHPTLGEVGKRYSFDQLLLKLQRRKLITGRLIFEKSNQYFLSCTVTTQEVAELHAKYVLEQQIKKENLEALNLFHSLTNGN